MKRQRRTKKELHGGFLPFLAMAAATLIPMAIDWGMGYKRNKDAENAQRAENERIAREDAEYQRQEAEALRKYQAVLPQAQARFAAEKEDARRRAEAQRQMTELEKQRANSAANLDRLSRMRNASAAEAAERNREAAEAAALSRESAQRIAQTTLAKTRESSQRLQSQSQAIMAAQQSVLQRDQERAAAIQRAQMAALNNQIPAVRRPVKAVGIQSLRGSGADAEAVAILQYAYGLTKAEAKRLLKSM